MKKNKLRCLTFFLIILLSLNALSCGTILYPERRGQVNGNVDPRVLILDALLLIPGIIPGVIAIAVDLTTGAIFLPPGEQVKMDDLENGLTPLDMPEEKVLTAGIEDLIFEKTGRRVSASSCRLFRAKNGESIRVFLKSKDFEAAGTIRL